MDRVGDPRHLMKAWCGVEVGGTLLFILVRVLSWYHFFWRFCYPHPTMYHHYHARSHTVASLASWPRVEIGDERGEVSNKKNIENFPIKRHWAYMTMVSRARYLEIISFVSSTSDTCPLGLVVPPLVNSYLQ